MEAVFGSYDTSGEGLIDQRELGVMLRAMGMQATEAEVQDIIALVDNDGSGKLDFPEFINLMTSRLGKCRRLRVKCLTLQLHRLKDTDVEVEEGESFGRFDADSDGIISFEDLSKVCMGLWPSPASCLSVEFCCSIDVLHSGGSLRP